MTLRDHGTISTGNTMLEGTHTTAPDRAKQINVAACTDKNLIQPFILDQKLHNSHIYMKNTRKKVMNHLASKEKKNLTNEFVVSQFIKFTSFIS